MTLSATFLKWYKTGNTFQFNNHPVFYKDEGAGDVVLCLHGFPSASWDWMHIWDGLKTRFRVIAPDMIGFGYSAKPRDYNYSILDQANLYQQLLEHLNIDTFHILAHDIGDNVTQELLARHFEAPRYKIQSVCLLNGGIFPEIINPRPIQKLLLQPVLGSLITLFYNRKIFGKQFSEVFGANTRPSSDELDEFWALIDQNMGQRIIHKLIRYIPEGVVHRERWVGALRKSSMPLKFINGIADPVSGKPMLERLQELIPGANVTSLAGIGHYPHVEAPAKTLSAYVAFLDTL